MPFNLEGIGPYRSTPVNFIQIAKNTLESYPRGLSHGVQKDAIQNGWDACREKTYQYVKDNWKFEFELVEAATNMPSMLVMTDFGTCGLTGEMTSSDIDEENMPPEEERWARWESLAFNKGDEESLGARGQGKMILMAASKDYLLYYDSIRDDGTYRMGGAQAKTVDRILIHKNGDEGKKLIKQRTGLEPIGQIGTRVIIFNPVDELVEKIKSGEFLNYIEESWWPVINGLDAKIYVKCDGKITRAQVPAHFPITHEIEETANFKTWIKSDLKFKFDRKEYKIKELCFACNIDSEIDEAHQGIAVFRGPMKVATISFGSRSLRNKVYGYVILDTKVNRLLRGVELPNHYDFRNIGIWKKVKDAIEIELEAFGNEKLELGINSHDEVETKRNSAENKALHILRDITKNWSILQSGSGPLPPDHPEVPSPPTPPKEIGIRLTDLKFPTADNSPRLNYDESIDGFFATIFNNTNRSVKLIYEAAVYSGDGDKLLWKFDYKNIKVESNNLHNSSKYCLVADEEKFSYPGKYKLKFTITDELTNDILDTIIRQFWVETEPEQRSPFEVKRRDFSEHPDPEFKKLEWILNYDGEDKTFIYNIEHPSYSINSEPEDRLVGYLSEIYCMGALQLVMQKAVNDEFTKNQIQKLPFDIEKLISEDPKIMYLELAKAISQFKYDIHNKI